MSFENREEGKRFESIFEDQCRRLGYHAERNHLTAKRGWNGKLIAVHSNLDFTVVDPRTGRVGFFDCKNFDAGYFTHSHIIKDNRQHQLDRAERYNLWNVPAGFVVWLREIEAILFYPGSQIATIGPGGRFGAHNGVLLGRWDRFEVSLLFSSPSGCSAGIS